MREASRGRSFNSPLSNGILISSLILSTLSATSTTRAHAATPHAPQADARTRTRERANAPASFTTADAQRLVANIKDAEPAAFRAYLYARVSAFLWERGLADTTLKRVAADAAATGVADIDRNFDEIPQTVARAFAEEMLALVARLDSAEAARLRRANAKAFPAPSAEEKTAADLHAALKSLDDPKTCARGLEDAARQIEGGAASIASVHGELLRLDARDSPSLPRLLSAVLTREEQAPGSFALMNMFFLSYTFLKETTPRDVRVRFINAAVRATQQVAPAQGQLSAQDGWVVPLLRAVLPHARKLTPELYPVVAARLAALAPGPAPEDVFARLNASDDPVSAAASEAAFTSDARMKSELLTFAAHKALERGELRRAAELMASTEEEERGDLYKWFSSRDEFLEGVSRKALESNNVETARYAASEIKLANYHAAALRLIAQRAAAAGDAQSAAQALDEALKILKAADEGKEKATALLLLAADSVEIDSSRAADFAREAVKAVNDMRRPRGDAAEVGEFTWHLFPVADAVTKTFRLLASRDREGAQSLAETFAPREFRLAATLGVYGAR